MFNNLPNFKLKVRNMKTRWGVCNKSSMSITLNTTLIHKDVTLIDYVIIHELCHLVEMNHSKRFWNLVNSFMPTMSAQKNSIKEYSFLLSLYGK